jgi:cyclic pyranopterin phosphate synthase
MGQDPSNARARRLSHLDGENRPSMVDVGDKPATARCAVARSRVWLPAEVRACLEGDELRSAKGPVFVTAILAGTMAAKRTADLIPFCHQIPLTSVKLRIAMEGEEAVIECTVRCVHSTGVEMEALTGASVAALTVYDMTKALSHAIEIRSTRLVSKSGGRSDHGA